MASASPTISSSAGPLAARFAQLRSVRHCALIPYITAGYPAPADTPTLLDALAASGADVIELGVPFSDPVADGPTIQRSSYRALEQGADMSWVLDTIRDFGRRHDVPVVVFSYLNPVVSYGVERFLADAAAAGVAGLLITDLPAGSDPGLEALLRAAPFPLIRLIAPTTPPSRMASIARDAQGFLYYVGRMGVTGAHAALRAETLAEVRALRALTDVPVAVGFGISTAAQAAEVARAADGVIVGSALIDALDRGGVPALAALMHELRMALRPG
jgi:tryptophan synthase alpha chain